MMVYQQLNEITVIEYLKQAPTLANLVTHNSKATEIGDGNINFVYIIDNLKDGLKLALKQAVPYLRCVGEEFALSKKRMEFESKSMQLYASLAPKQVPQIYHVDNDMALMVMRCLDQHIIMRKGLIAEIIYPHFVEQITDYLANTLFKTSSLYLSSKAKRGLMQDYLDNDELCKITEDFVFTTPFMIHETNPANPALQSEHLAIQHDTLFKCEILKLKNKFLNQPDALIHGDLHTGSLMVNKNETMVIDSEFAFFGPIGFDLGALIANLLLAWVSHFERSKNANYQTWLLETVVALYQTFAKKFLTLWNEHAEQTSGLLTPEFCQRQTLAQYQQFYLQQILQDSIGFAGIKMARRILGIAGVAEIRDIEDTAARARAEKLALAIAKQLVLQRMHITNITDILPILSKEFIAHEQR